jgi:transcriptional regulator with GAF, ATPase, and Fis domain
MLSPAIIVAVSCLIIAVLIISLLATRSRKRRAELECKRLTDELNERQELEKQLQEANDELQHLKNQLEAENIYLQQELQSDEQFGEIVGQSDAIKYVLFKITQVAPTDTTVLITGETGTGKELVTRAIHGASSRRDRPLIKVNCGALSPTLIESELFGHEKGAFTGAVGRKQGRFELANGGTIFLDEIGELPPELQVKLLRVIQENEFERLGGNKTIKADVRIIAATNRNLKAKWSKERSGGPVVSRERLPDHDAAAASAQGRHPIARRALRQHVCEKVR